MGFTELEKRERARAASRKFQKANPKKCSAKKKAYRKRNPEKTKCQRLRKRYGITLDDYKDMLQIQNECCAICKKHKSTFNTPLGVDHCHVTSKVRGLLCGRCNRAIGLFDDDPTFLENAQLYLEVENKNE